MQNYSKKHHYVPVFYQKAFTSKDRELYSLNKDFGTIKSRTPMQILYEMDLHTLVYGSDRTIMIEEYYSKVEGMFSEYSRIIRDNIDSPFLIDLLSKNEDFQRIAKLMVAFQFWRSPCNKELASRYSSQILIMYDKSDNEIKQMFGNDRKFIKFILKRMDKEPIQKVIQFVLLPMISFDLSRNIKRLAIYRAKSDIGFITSDSPVIYDDINDLFGFKVFLFPFSRNLLLAGVKTEIKSVNIDEVNRLIFQKAQKFVVGSSKSQLEGFV